MFEFYNLIASLTARENVKTHDALGDRSYHEMAHPLSSVGAHDNEVERSACGEPTIWSVTTPLTRFTSTSLPLVDRLLPGALEARVDLSEGVFDLNIARAKPSGKRHGRAGRRREAA